MLTRLLAKQPLFTLNLNSQKYNDFKYCYAMKKDHTYNCLEIHI